MSDFGTPAALQTIQAILAPALLISACGLLLLGLNNRYAIVIARIRSLNDEKRRKLSDPESIDREYIDVVRFESVMHQIPSLRQRANHLRHALICLWAGVFCDLVCSMMLGANLVFSADFATFAVLVFLVGIASAASGVIFALLDIFLAHKVLKLEAEVY